MSYVATRVSQHYLYVGKSHSVAIQLLDIGPASRVMFQFQRAPHSGADYDSRVAVGATDKHDFPIYLGTTGADGPVYSTGITTGDNEANNRRTIIQLWWRAIGASTWIPCNGTVGGVAAADTHYTTTAGGATSTSNAIQGLTGPDVHGVSWGSIGSSGTADSDAGAITNGELPRVNGVNIGLGRLRDIGAANVRVVGDNIFSTVATWIPNTEIQVRKTQGAALDLFVCY